MTDATLREEADGYWTRTTSPDRAYTWVVDADEVKMSHWIMGGALYRCSPVSVLFKAPYGWSFEGRTWVEPHVLRLEGRRYPGRLPGITLTLDAIRGIGTLQPDDLASLHQQGSHLAVRQDEIPAAPDGPIPFDGLLRWLETFPST